jgi:hypothetical protein
MSFSRAHNSRLKRQLIAERDEALLNSSKIAPSPAEMKAFSKSYLKPSEVNSPRLKLPELK